jgi:hypothetical protein
MSLEQRLESYKSLLRFYRKKIKQKDSDLIWYKFYYDLREIIEDLELEIMVEYLLEEEN